MNNISEKIRTQWEIVLKGEANLQQSAMECHVNLELIEQSIDALLEKRIIFGSGDPIKDLMMGAYMIGRKAQFVASMADLVGKEELQSLLNQATIKLGLQSKKLN